MLGGSKFAIHGGLTPVYRRPRFDYGEGLLSGPAWAGLLAVLSARRNALRAWLGEGATRSLVVGALAASLGVQASTTPSAAQSAAKGQANRSHSSAARQATGGRGLAAGILSLPASGGDHRADAANVPGATDAAQRGVGGSQGQRLPIPGLGAAPAPGQWIDVLSDIRLFDLFATGGPYSSFGRPGNDSARSSTGEASDSGLGSVASASSGLPSNDDLPAAGRFFGWQIGLPIVVQAGPAGSGSIDIASGSGPDIAHGSASIFEGAQSQGQSGVGSADLGVASLSGGPPGSLGGPGPGGVSEAFHVAGLVGGGSGGFAGVPEPAAWATMLVGLALVGGSVRQRRAHA